MEDLCPCYVSYHDLLCCSTGYMDPEAFNNRLCARALYDYTARQVKVSYLGIWLTVYMKISRSANEPLTPLIRRVQIQNNKF